MDAYCRECRRLWNEYCVAAKKCIRLTRSNTGLSAAKTEYFERLLKEAQADRDAIQEAIRRHESEAHTIRGAAG
jgi:hypothetical protein